MWKNSLQIIILQSHTWRESGAHLLVATALLVKAGEKNPTKVSNLGMELNVSKANSYGMYNGKKPRQYF
jgi:hypothetical protein